MEMVLSLESIGFNEKVEQNVEQVEYSTAQIGRVFRDAYHIYRILDGQREITAVLSGRLKHLAASKSALPVVGDWVYFEEKPGRQSRVIGLVPRYSRLSRKVVGDLTEEQVLVANVDTVFLVNGLDQEVNPRRIERFLTLSKEGGIRPVILLNKSDVNEQAEEVVLKIKSIASGVAVHAVSAVKKTGLESLQKYLKLGRTFALIGSSGVGKSSIVNALLNSEVLPTGEVHKATFQGKHTTVRREMIFTPNGALLIDTPGLRELQIWADSGSVEKTFSDIEAIALHCRFRDCKHGEEPGCAVREAVQNGELDLVRVESFRKQMQETELLLSRKKEMQRKKERRKKFNRKSLQDEQNYKHSLED